MSRYNPDLSGSGGGFPWIKLLAWLCAISFGAGVLIIVVGFFNGAFAPTPTPTTAKAVINPEPTEIPLSPQKIEVYNMLAINEKLVREDCEGAKGSTLPTLTSGEELKLTSITNEPVKRDTACKIYTFARIQEEVIITLNSSNTSLWRPCDKKIAPYGNYKCGGPVGTNRFSYQAIDADVEIGQSVYVIGVDRNKMRLSISDMAPLPTQRELEIIQTRLTAKQVHKVSGTIQRGDANSIHLEDSTTFAISNDYQPPEGTKVDVYVFDNPGAWGNHQLMAILEVGNKRMWWFLNEPPNQDYNPVRPW